MKILTVLGARPQFIKASVVSAAIAASSRLTEIVLHTGQHFDANMSDVFFAELGMRKPDHHLGIHGGGQGEMTGRMLIGIEKVLLAEKPDAVLVYGDTNSTLAGSLAAVKLHIPVAHVEAGLRSFNMAMPEEVNRILTDRVSRWLFTPTVAARENLLREGVPAERIVPVGDVMYDVALQSGGKVSEGGGLLERLGFSRGRYVLATVHRAENTDRPERLASIVDALEATGADLPVVWPLHPRTRAALRETGRLDALASRVRLIEPVGYLDMVQLEKYAGVIATDSGGVQKEAFFHGVPCVTLRDETEWVELVESGWNRLASPADPSSMRRAIAGALGSRGGHIEPYGDGNAAGKIVVRLENGLTGETNTGESIR
ncbi:MAG: UDP-N-acetylglucosamine 2-epimerase (non-hydrolyzing) [Deltaproteobacteria bacterium]|nr:UDP-N-acetylglucosamine 2-epimerase (non-hydrolyzing) [Deltaproteobacteria bacterium]